MGTSNRLQDNKGKQPYNISRRRCHLDILPHEKDDKQRTGLYFLFHLGLDIRWCSVEIHPNYLVVQKSITLRSKVSSLDKASVLLHTLPLQ